MITTDNYEGYLMRYADGELDDNEVAMVEAFLDAHPDLREELDAITDPSLKITPPLVTMPSKEKMLQPVAAASNSSRYIWYSIAAALALLLAFGIVLQMGRHNENPIIAQNGEIHRRLKLETGQARRCHLMTMKPLRNSRLRRLCHLWMRFTSQ